MAAEEYSPDDPFDESPPKEMKYLKNPKKMTISQFENIPKNLIADKNLEEGKIYYIEDVGRRKKDYREVFQNTTKRWRLNRRTKCRVSRCKQKSNRDYREKN